MPKKRVFLGLSIIAGGVCASLPFRRETPLPYLASASSPTDAASPLLEQPVAPASRGPALPVARSAALALGGPSPYVEDSSVRPLRGNSRHAPTAPLIEEIASSAKEKPATPPMLPVSFQVKELAASHSDPWQPARLTEGPAEPPREYRIRKLDTLEDLAERFLGSRDRAVELFEANRGILKDRHILPIGGLIRIPSTSEGSPANSSESDLQPVRASAER